MVERIEMLKVVYKGSGKLAKRLKVSRPHLSYVLHGARKPGPKLERKLRRLGLYPACAEVADVDGALAAGNWKLETRN